jgi:hypothetical protein
MNKSVKLAVQLSLGVISLHGSADLLAQEELGSTPADVGQSDAGAAVAATPELVEQKEEAAPTVQEAKPEKASVASSAANKESQAYWVPTGEPTIPLDTASVPPVEFEDPASASSLAEEEPDDLAFYDKLWHMSGANVWNGSTPGTAGFAPVGPPSGFNAPPAVYPAGRGGDSILRGFGFGVSLSGMYDSNVKQSSGAGSRDKPDDFITSLGGSVSYMSQADVWTFGGSYSGSYNFYENNSEFNGYSQSGSLIANYDGAKLSSSVTVGLSTGRGGNRYLGTSDFVEQDQINVALAARYVYSPKTTLSLDAGHSFISTSGGDFFDTNGSYLGLSALWRYSALTEFGPGIRIARDTGGGSNTRTSIGPTLNLNHRYSSKLSLTSQIGLNFADYSGSDSSDESISTSIGLNYQASPLWGLNLAVFRNVQADPSVSESFREVTAVRLGYNRKIRRANLGLGVSYEHSSTVEDGVGISRPGRDYYSLDGSLGMRIFADTTDATIFIRYSDQSAGSIESFDAFQVGFSLSRGF